MADIPPVSAARSVSARIRSFSPAVNVRRFGRSESSGSAAAGAGTTVGLRPSSVPAPAAALASTTLLGMTTRQFSYALKSKLPGGLCLIIIGTEGTVLPEPDFHRLDRASFAWRTRTDSQQLGLVPCRPFSVRERSLPPGLNQVQMRCAFGLKGELPEGMKSY